MKIIGTGVMLQTSKGTYLLQKRDMNAVMRPGMIAPFGGGVEGDESLKECAIREMKEELGLNLKVSNLEEIKLFESKEKPGIFIQMFLVRNVDQSIINLMEGEAIVETSKENALKNDEVTDFTKEVLNLL